MSVPGRPRAARHRRAFSQAVVGWAGDRARWRSHWPCFAHRRARAVAWPASGWTCCARHDAVIGPHRGRRARRRSLLGSSSRSPCPTPCHATTGAASVLHPWTIPSSAPSATCRVAHAGPSCPTFRLRALSCAGARVQPLRPRANLLRCGLRRNGAPTVATRGWPALPGQPARAVQACRAYPALAPAQGGVGLVAHVAHVVGSFSRTVRGAIGDASGFPNACLGCCTDPLLIDARRCRSTCAGGTRPAMQGRHHQQHVHGDHAGKLGRRRPAEHLADLALPLVPNTLRGTRTTGLPAPQPVCAQGQSAGGAHPWP